ncbi:WbqC family protein [Nonlabens mediterrranea]|uniref:WbqC family protein n=2 Tax=Nonlabens mediterrranea TaxID=1419947 RepID=A0ABS0A2N5_9FLAO|nr:WbqC family protein [Nonlabens mediterrranea]
MSKLFVIQSNYIPWKGYFDAINKADVVVIYDEMQYTKNDWRNRNKIKTSNGTQWLTIPVLMSGKFGQKINETQVFDKKWAIKHWKTLKQNYSKATYFKEIEELLFPIYNNIMTDNLSEINMLFIKAILYYLGITTKIIRSKDLVLHGDKNERLIGLCNQLNCNRYISGPAAKSYMDLELFASNHIKVEFLEYSGYKVHKQLFNDFEPLVSIVDILFNEGPNSRDYVFNDL